MVYVKRTQFYQGQGAHGSTTLCLTHWANRVLSSGFSDPHLGSSVSNPEAGYRRGSIVSCWPAHQTPPGCNLHPLLREPRATPPPSSSSCPGHVNKDLLPPSFLSPSEATSPGSQTSIISNVTHAHFPPEVTGCHQFHLPHAFTCILSSPSLPPQPSLRFSSSAA